MTSFFSGRRVGCALRLASVILAVSVTFSPCVYATSLSQSAPTAQGSAKQSSESGPSLRIPRQEAFTTAAVDGILRDAGFSNRTLPIPAAALSLRNLETGQFFRATASAEGVFRLFPLPPGRYELRVEANDYAAFVLPELTLLPDEFVSLEISLVNAAPPAPPPRLPLLLELGSLNSAGTQPTSGTYRELRRRLDSDPTYVENVSREVLPPVADVYNAVPDRWALDQPGYRRY